MFCIKSTAIWKYNKTNQLYILVFKYQNIVDKNIEP